MWDLSTYESDGRWGVRGASMVRGVDFHIPPVHDSDDDAMAAGVGWVDRYEQELARVETPGTTITIGE